MRYNPGERIYLFDIESNLQNKSDWERAKKYFSTNKHKLPASKFFDIRIYWEVPPY